MATAASPAPPEAASMPAAIGSSRAATRRCRRLALSRPAVRTGGGGRWAAHGRPDGRPRPVRAHRAAGYSGRTAVRLRRLGSAGHVTVSAGRDQRMPRRQPRAHRPWRPPEATQSPPPHVQPADAAIWKSASERASPTEPPDRREHDDPHVPEPGTNAPSATAHNNNRQIQPAARSRSAGTEAILTGIPPSRRMVPGRGLRSPAPQRTAAGCRKRPSCSSSERRCPKSSCRGSRSAERSLPNLAQQRRQGCAARRLERLIGQKYAPQQSRRCRDSRARVGPSTRTAAGDALTAARGRPLSTQQGARARRGDGTSRPGDPRLRAGLQRTTRSSEFAEGSRTSVPVGEAARGVARGGDLL